MTRGALIVIALSCAAPTARADAGELELSVAPHASVLNRHQRWFGGGGLGLRAAFGLDNNVSAEVELDCDGFYHLRDAVFVRTISGVGFEGGRLRYNNARCSLVPSLAIQHGSRFIGGLSFGVGYRRDMNFDRKLSRSGLEPRWLGRATFHQAVVRVRGSLRYRLSDAYAVGFFAYATPVIFGGELDPDVAVGATVSMFSYP